jgi:hypothetical protein
LHGFAKNRQNNRFLPVTPPTAVLLSKAVLG